MKKSNSKTIDDIDAITADFDSISVDLQSMVSEKAKNNKKEESAKNVGDNQNTNSQNQEEKTGNIFQDIYDALTYQCVLLKSIQTTLDSISIHTFDTARNTDRIHH